MGLDISVYSKLTKIDAVFDRDGEAIDPVTRKYLDGHYCRPHPNPYFQGREDGLDLKAIYQYGRSFGFRAGSYSGYNVWREQLAAFAGWPAMAVEQYGATRMRHDRSVQDATEGPFYELIWFADNEGTIGAVTSAKLAKDFADHQAKADAHPDEYWRGKYNEWRKAFEMASDGGCVVFH